MMRSLARTPKVPILLFVVIAIGGALRFVTLSSQSLWLDEAFTVNVNLQPGSWTPSRRSPYELPAAPSLHLGLALVPAIWRW